MRLSIVGLLVLIPGVLAAGALASPAALYRGDAAGTGRYARESADRVVGVRFTVDVGAPIRATPAILDGRLFVGGTDGVFRAMDAHTGQALWRYRTHGAITSSAAVAQDRVSFASRDGFVYCLRARDGRLVWRHRVGADLGSDHYWDYLVSSPVVVDAMLFIGAGDGAVLALDAGDGRVRWRFDAHARVRSTVALANGRVIFGTTDGRVYALRQRDGALLWTFATEGAAHAFADQGNDTTSIVASPTFAGDIVAIGGRDGFLYGLDPATGAQRWRITHDGSSWILATAYDGVSLYVASGSAQLVQAVDPATGVERWRYATRGAVFSSLALAGNTLLFADFTGTVHAVDATSGTRRWAFPIRARALSTPVVAEGIAYCAGDDGVLRALDLEAAPTASTPPADMRRIAYWQGAPPGAFGWFQNGVDAAFLAYLVSAGYERMGRDELLAFLRDADPARSASVVVFVDNRMPPAWADATLGTAPIRRYLDAGGKAVVLGPNPLAYVTDSTGQLDGIDYAIPQRVFDVRFEAPAEVGGYYASFPTAAGRAIGLRSPAVGSGAIDPGQAVVTLMRDEFGKASAWLKPYGGRRGTGLLQLSLPRQETQDFSELRTAIEAGVGW